MAQSREILGYDGWNTKWGGIINNHKKAAFSTKSKLINNWEFLRKNLGWINNRFEWEETDSVCGCDCSSEEFYKTKREDLKEKVA